MTDHIPIARLTDPRLIAAQIRAWRNVVQLVAKTLAHPTDPPHVWHILNDLATQMNTVAAREDRVYPDRTPKPSWEHRGEEQ